LPHRHIQRCLSAMISAATPASGSPAHPVNLLWTAGWDSTYRLLTLVLGQGRAVSPHYIVDPGRPGTPHELLAMREIRTHIAQAYPDRAELIQPTRATLLDSIPPNEMVSAKLTRLRCRGHLGEQYDWLARYVVAAGIVDLELCIHADDKAEAFLRDHVEHVTDENNESYWQLKPCDPEDDLALFTRFRMPILSLTKRDMRARADAAGFQPIMGLTWFCHTPIDGKPCGTCNPCRYTIDEGLSERLPGRALLRHRY